MIVVLKTIAKLQQHYEFSNKKRKLIRYKKWYSPDYQLFIL